MININSTTSQTRLNGCCCNFFEISLSISPFSPYFDHSPQYVYVYICFFFQLLDEYCILLQFIIFYSIYAYLKVNSLRRVFMFMSRQSPWSTFSLFFIILLLFHLRIVLFVFYVQCNHISIIASSVSN